MEDIHARPLPAPGNALIVPLPATLTEPAESGRERKKKDLFRAFLSLSLVYFRRLSLVTALT